MKKHVLAFAEIALLALITIGVLVAQQVQPPTGPQPFSVGIRLGLPITPAPDGKFDPMSKNVKTSSILSPLHSCGCKPSRFLSKPQTRTIVSFNPGSVRPSEFT